MTIQTNADPSGSFDRVLVLVGDAQRARIVRPAAGLGLELLWEGYATSPDVRALDQAPDITRNSKDATPAVRGENGAEFARDVAAQVRSTSLETRDERLMVIAPHSFAVALRAELGAAWPSRRSDVIERDETRLDDAALRILVETTLKNHP